MVTPVQVPGRGRGERILINQTSYLGDVILTTPLLAEMRRCYPEAELDLLCTPRATSLVDNNPDIDHIVADDKRGKGRGLKGMWRMAMELRRRRYTMALSPHKSLRSALLLFLARIPCRIGFRQSAGWFLYHHRVNRDTKLHDVDRNLSLLQAFGMDPGSSQKKLRIEVDPVTRERVEQIWNSLGLERREGQLIFGLNPGSVWPTKRWSVEGYANLMVQLKKKYRCEVVLFGGPEDREIADRIQELSGHVGLDLVGRTSLRELPCALERCDVFITNDSAPMHIAVSRGIPVVALFCATTPSLGFYPYSSRATVVQKELPCRPCTSHGGRRCPLGTEDCIHLVGAEDVLRGVEQVMNGKDQSDSTSENPFTPNFITL